MSTSSAISMDSNVLHILKRDGKTRQLFQSQKIRDAIKGAWVEVTGVVDVTMIDTITGWVVSQIGTLPSLTVEGIQDIVEIALMKFGHFDIAKAYILYRQKRAEIRAAAVHPDPAALEEYIQHAKYARHIPLELRREWYIESTRRVRDMHKRRFPHLVQQIDDVFDKFVDTKKVLASMRSMQYGGKAIEVNNARIFNCSFTFVDRPRVFQEALWLLLSGCGVGYSIQFDHVDKLPRLTRVNVDSIVHHIVADNIEGWGDALGALVRSYLVEDSPEYGKYVEFAFHEIRAKGIVLKTSGGRAPGHRPLKRTLDRVRTILDGAQGRKLRPIECHDILCHGADAVLDGGNREAAMIALFSLEDSEMIYAKTGEWYVKYPWRARANNSVMLKRSEVRKKQFKRIFQMTREWGEPGFYFCESYEYGANPCVEIGLNPRLILDAQSILEIQRTKGDKYPETRSLHIGDSYTGWAFCNLVELNAAKFESIEDFMAAAEAGTFIGTLQAAYTDMPYLGWVSEHICEREALLGVSMTGMMRTPSISCNPEIQRAVALKTIEWNRKFAIQVGVKPAARITCVKPAGTSSKILGIGATGIHPDHARKYINRVGANENQISFQAMKATNPHMCVRKPDGKWVIEFPVEAPATAIIKADVSALQFLEIVKSTQCNWVVPGTADETISPGLRHNVSNTIHVKEHEWEDVANYLWDNRESFTGVALLPFTGDKQYAFAPYEAITTEADEAHFRQLVANYKPIDWTAVLEDEDGTNLMGEQACAGGACLI